MVGGKPYVGVKRGTQLNIVKPGDFSTLFNFVKLRSTTYKLKDSCT